MEALKLRELFFDSNYTIENLLLNAKQNNLTLSQLRDSLILYQQDLNQNLLELFNNNYDQFYKLSYIMTCLNEPVQQLYEPLETFRSQLESLCKKHDSYIDDVNNKLSAIEDTCENKELASVLLGLVRTRDRLEQQTKNLNWALEPVKSEASSTDLDIEYKIKCDLMERLTIELFYLNCRVIAIKPTNDELKSIKKSLQISIDRLREKLDFWFQSLFLKAIENQEKVMIDFVLATYKQIRSINRINSTWTNKLLKPYLDISLAESQLMDTKQLPLTFGLLYKFLERQSELIEDEFVIRSFWGETIIALDKVERFYSLNDLEAFQKRFTQTRVLLDKQKKCIERGLKEEEVNANTESITKKFNLETYFNHRCSQLTTIVETSLSQQPLSEIPANLVLDTTNEANNAILCQFKVKICMHMYSLITRCWSEDIYIEELEEKFVELACKIINRFGEWLGKLRLSDFRITNSAQSDNKQTDFLAKRDAIMRLLLEDCDRLVSFLSDTLFGAETSADEVVKSKRSKLLSESFSLLRNNLSNVRSLQNLIER